MVISRGWIFLSFIGLLILGVFMTADEYYKAFAWPETDATVISVHRTCSYEKKRAWWGRHRYDTQHVPCDDKDEIARLTSEGYKPTPGVKQQIEVAYEAEPGEKTFVTFDAYTRMLEPGSRIRIRTSSGNAELAVKPGLVRVAFTAIVGVLFGLYIFLMRTFDEPIY